MDRPIEPHVLRGKARRRLITYALSGVVGAGILILLPGWVRPTIVRSTLRTATVERGPIDATLTASGLVLPEREFVVTSPSQSRILAILHQPGDTLKAGEPILKLDEGEARLGVERLDRQAALKANERDLARVGLEATLNDLTGRAQIKKLEQKSLEFDVARNKRLATEGIISGDAARKSQTDLERAGIEVEQLGAARKNAERGLEVRLKALDLELDILQRERAEAARTLEQGSASSPQAGVLTWVLSGEGVAVNRGDELARVADLSTFKVEATISDVHAGQIRAGQPVLVQAGERMLPGVVSKVHPKVENGIVRLEVALAAKSDPGLRPNLRVDVQIVTDHRESALRVKRGSLVGVADGYALFRIRNGAAERRAIQLGITNLERVEIVSGLNEGDEVILSDMSDYASKREVRIK